LFTKTRHIIVGIIDFFHRPFARFIPTQTFRYLACGGTNTVLNIFIFSLCLKFIFTQEKLHLFAKVNITADVAAYAVAFCISFPIGFILSRHIVFPESNLHGKIQFFRYILATVTLIVFTYLLIKFFDFLLGFIPHTKDSYEVFNFKVAWVTLHSIAYTCVTIITAILSYISQRKFTFKTIDKEVVVD